MGILKCDTRHTSFFFALTHLADISCPSWRAGTVERCASGADGCGNSTSAAMETRRRGAHVIHYFAISAGKTIGTFAQVLVRFRVLTGTAIVTRLPSPAIIQI